VRPSRPQGPAHADWWAIWGSWARYVCKHDIGRFAQFAVRVMGCPMDYDNPENAALAGIEAKHNKHAADLVLHLVAGKIPQASRTGQAVVGQAARPHQFRLPDGL